MTQTAPSILFPLTQRVPSKVREESDLLSRRPILIMVAISAAGLFLASALRHHLFRSGAMDLAFFDQLTYLISRGEKPVSSMAGWHLLGDHAAYMLYLLAPLYWIWPNVHMLLLAQAAALASGAYPVWRLARLAGLSPRTARAISAAYLLYPIVLTANLFDFHPEVLSVPAILFAVLAARERRMTPFVFAIFVALGGKEIIGVTVAAMGLWLAVFEDRKRFGVVAMIAGLGWFLVATRWLIPLFGGGKQASGIQFFAYLGSSPLQIAINALLHPHLWLPNVLTFHTLKYLAILFAPLAWALRPRHMLPLICAAPTLAMNLLAHAPGVDLTNPFAQYSLMVIPFAILCVIGAVAARQTWFHRPRLIQMWSFGLIVVGVTARLGFTNSYQATNFTNQVAAREAVARVAGGGGVLTTHEIAPHLSHRRLVQFISDEQRLAPIASLDNFDYVLLNLTDDSSKASGPRTISILEQVQRDRSFALVYQNDWVYLFRRTAAKQPGEPVQARIE